MAETPSPDQGDLTAAGALVDAAAQRWSGRWAQSALDALADAAGIDAVVAELGAGSAGELMLSGSTPARRMHGVRVEHAAARDVTGALADPSRDVARTAWELIAESACHDASLWALARTDGPARPWAIAALHRHGHDVADLARAVDRVPLPGVPDAVRTAIVRAFTPGGRRTDPRWLAEGAACGAALLESSSPEPEFSPLPEEAACTLAAAGVGVAEPVAIRDQVGAGQGNYYVITVGDGRVDVSTVGPFVRVTGTPPPGTTDALVDNGFLLIDENMAVVRVDGLTMQYGPGDVLTVGELLFDWDSEE